MAKKLKIYNGSSWEDVTFAITPPNTAVTNAFTTNQVIDTSTSVAALRVTQRGTGEALRIEDETNPDLSPFVIDATGNVGIGGTNDTLYGRLQILGSGYQAISIKSTDTSGVVFSLAANSSNDVRINAVSNHPIAFYTNNSEKMRLTSDGNLGIGLTNPTYRIQTSNSLAAPLNSQTLAYQSHVFNGNNDYLSLYQERTIATTSWGGSDWILRRQVDNSPMGGFRWAAGDWNVRAIYGIPANASVRTTHIGTSAPSGGIDGDVWLVYTA
jgi:hypothetical protein